MKRFSQIATLTAVMTLSPGLAITSGTDRAMAQAANPCATKPANPPAQTATNPQAKPEIDPKLVLRPVGTKLASGNEGQFTKQGKALFNDTKLSTNGVSCASCHLGNANFASGFAAPYPHQVAMARDKSGLAQVQLDEMIQLCIIVPMATKPLPWDSPQLAALTAYTSELQTAFRKQATKAGATSTKRANPCASKK